jgi:hypothetical protein
MTGIRSDVNHTVAVNAVGNMSASGSVSIPIALFRAGEYRVQAFTNTLLANASQRRVCGGGGKIVIRSANLHLTHYFQSLSAHSKIRSLNLKSRCRFSQWFF